MIASCFLLVLPSVSFAQTKEMEDEIKAKLATLKYVYSLETPTGGFKPYIDGETALRPTSAAVRAIKYLGGTVPNAEKHAEFVMKCYDPISGGFSELPGGKPDVFITSVGVMAAMELGIPKIKFEKAMVYLKVNAKTFEDVRIGAAAVEAWGVKDCPFNLKPWLDVADQESVAFLRDAQDGDARTTGSIVAMWLRLGRTIDKKNTAGNIMRSGQVEDGGWRKKDAKGSDLETCYRVMRAFYLLKEKPKDTAKLRAFIARCRNKDGGYGVMPGDKSSVSAVYYVAVISKWLDEME